MMQKPLLSYPVAISALILLAAAPSSADSILLKNGQKVKGLIVDEYADRITVSTHEGEKSLDRADVDYIRYEEEETRLMKLADAATGRNDYEQAIYYYGEVLKINPKSKAAKEGVGIAVGRSLTAGSQRAKEEVELMTSLDASPSSGDKTALYEKNIKELLGLTLARDDEKKACFVKAVAAGSASALYRVEPGDIINAVWNTNARYMKYGDVVRRISGPEMSMVKLTFERVINFGIGTLPQLEIGLERNGYFVKKVSGLSDKNIFLIAPGDWIVEVNSFSTRYMPKNKLVEFLASRDATSLAIRRDIYMMRQRGDDYGKAD